MNSRLCLLAALACLSGSAAADAGTAPGQTSTAEVAIASLGPVAATTRSDAVTVVPRRDAAAAVPRRDGTGRTGPERGTVDPELRALLQQAVATENSFQDRFDAEVWLTDMSHRLAAQVPDPAERIEILKAVHREAIRDHISPELVLAVIDVESNFDRYAISSTSALGLMQVMPFWVKEVGGTDKNQLFDIDFNVLLGCRILKYYLDMENGDFVQALARYNGSTGQRGYADRVLARLRTKWFWL